MKEILCNCCEEFTCKDIDKKEIISVYGAMRMAFIDMYCINYELAEEILKDKNIEYIAQSEEDENGETVDYTCCEYYLVNPYDEERTINILKNSGMAFELFFVKGEYILVKDFYNMSNKSVKTNIKYTDDYKKTNCFDNLWEEE